ncbi:MAG: ACP S-malonyltransferase [Ruminococcus sp.]|jgi:[acyl-carrier-protein] S-malonyltransferase|nr:ACP S-malonyltransferase [Ruminococcus sp.]
MSDNQKTVFLFPGQGSAYAGMGQDILQKAHDIAKSVFETASEILGYNLFHVTENAEKLAHTRYAQPAIAAVSVISAKIRQQRGETCEAVAGHSLGEYPAMQFSGIITLEGMFELLKIRGEAMESAAEAQKGVMYAVMGADIFTIEKICADTPGLVVPANFNSAAQTVIAGLSEPCETAAQKLSAEGAKTIKLAVAGAFHTELMKSAADTMLEAAKRFTFKTPEIPFYSNLTGARLYDFSDFAQKIADHITSPVRFKQELESLYSDGFTNYLEAAPGKVLTGCVKKTLKGVEAKSF